MSKLLPYLSAQSNSAEDSVLELCFRLAESLCLEQSQHAGDHQTLGVVEVVLAEENIQQARHRICETYSLSPTVSDHDILDAFNRNPEKLPALPWVGLGVDRLKELAATLREYMERPDIGHSVVILDEF
jgi:hypothetical protein